MTRCSGDTIPCQAGDTAPCRMTGVTLQSHVRSSYAGLYPQSCTKARRGGATRARPSPPPAYDLWELHVVWNSARPYRGTSLMRNRPPPRTPPSDPTPRTPSGPSPPPAYDPLSVRIPARMPGACVLHAYAPHYIGVHNRVTYPYCPKTESLFKMANAFSP